MSRLEDSNKLLITELARGRRDTIGLQGTAATNLARWVFKTALALHAASNYRKIIPPDHYRHLESKPDLPLGVHVFGKVWNLPASGFSWWQSPSWWVRDSGRDLSTSEEAILQESAYKICICLSQLLLLVAFNPLPHTSVLAWQHIHIPLWVNKDRVAWFWKPPDGFPSEDTDKATIAFLGSLGLDLQ